jgi:hypothetical protein
MSMGAEETGSLENPVLKSWDPRCEPLPAYHSHSCGASLASRFGGESEPLAEASDAAVSPLRRQLASVQLLRDRLMLSHCPGCMETRANMNAGNWGEAIKVGVSAFAWTTRLKESHRDLFSQLRDFGPEGFEIPLPDPYDLALVDLRRAVERSNLEWTVCALLPAEINPISPDASTRKMALAYLVDCIERSAHIGALLIGGPFFALIGYLRGCRRNRNEWDWAVECFQSPGESLEKHDMTLSMEPVNRSETFLLYTGRHKGIPRRFRTSVYRRNHRHFSSKYRREGYCGISRFAEKDS